MRAAWERGMKRIGVPVTGARANEEGEARDGKEEDTRIVRIVDGSFEDFSLSGLKPGSVDCVVIAQAWHWCPDYDRAFVSPPLNFLLLPSSILAVWAG